MLKLENLVENEYYTDEDVFFQCLKKGVSYGKGIRKSTKVYAVYNDFSVNSEKIRKLSLEEKHWLNCCIQADKFISYEEAMKTFNQEPFCIELNSQEELDAIMSFYKEKGYTEYGSSHTYKKGYIVNINPKNKKWQTATGNNLNYPIKTLSELGIEIKPQFEVGKWYTHKKWSENSYIKFHSFRDYNSVNELERISQGIYSKNPNWSISYEHTLIPVDLSEIQEYLPDEHPDKFSKSEKKYEYEVVSCTTQEEWNFVCNAIKCTFLNSWNVNREDSCINIHNKMYGNKNGIVYGGGKAKIYSFSEWCEKFNHKPDFMKETNCEFKVGDFITYDKKDVLKITEIIKDSYHGYWINHTPLSFSGGGFGLNAYISKIKKSTIQEIQTIAHTLTDEEILDVCKQYYPVGTRFKSPAKGYIFTVADNSFRFDNNLIVNTLENNQVGDKYGCIFRKSSQKFAEIISSPKEETFVQFGDNGYAVFADTISNHLPSLSFTEDVIEVGDEVQMISDNPIDGFGDVEIGDRGIVTSIGTNRYTIDFPNHSEWVGLASELKLIKKASQTTNSIKKVDCVSPTKVNTNITVKQAVKPTSNVIINVKPISSNIRVQINEQKYQAKKITISKTTITI